jgi:DeoR/GlpR family transcriptional regulator of sugar metabolism
MAAEGSQDGDRTTRLPAGRKADLAAYVAEMGQVTVSALADRFAVSPDTIRRDLDQLDAEGLLIRTHGGAVSTTTLPRPDTGLDIRMRLQIRAKESIGALAAGLVEDGSSLMLNGGTTVLALVRHLRYHRQLTIATNNLRIPFEISSEIIRDLYLFGGSVRLVSETTTGSVRFQVMSSTSEHPVRCDLACIAVGGVSPEDGYSTSNLEDAAMMREMMERATRVAVLADSSKFGRRLFAQVAELGRPDYFITDATPPPELEKALQEVNVELITPAATS